MDKNTKRQIHRLDIKYHDGVITYDQYCDKYNEITGGINMASTITPRVKVQTIFYERHDGELGKEYATADKRLTREEASDILDQRNIEHKDVLQQKYEWLNLELPLSELKNYIV